MASTDLQVEALQSGENKVDMLPFETPLCEIAYKYGTDKCPQINHTYTVWYYDLFKDKRDSVKKVVELGIGTRIGMGRRAQKHYVTGAGLYMWRDFFPNAHIYGADFMGTAMFEADRITTVFCDEREEKDLINLAEVTGPDVDLFIDDAAHQGCRQAFACITLMPLFNKDILYIIEDVAHSKRLMRDLRYHGYDCEKIHDDRGCLVLVRHRK